MLSSAASLAATARLHGNATVGGDSLQEVVQRWQRVRAQLQRRLPSSRCANGRQLILPLLSEALALTLLCAGRYRKHALADPMIATDYLRYALEAQCLAEQIAAYIHRLRSTPSFEPIRLSEPLFAASEEEETLGDLLAEDLIAGRVAVRSCREAVIRLQAQDPRTRHLFEALLTIQERHVSGLSRLHAQVRGSATHG